MGYKIFVSYKYQDHNVAKLEGGKNQTPRDYVDYLQKISFSGDDVNKAEIANEDYSGLTDEAIKKCLAKKIWDSSITLVLISPNMVDLMQAEKNQWIPWEIAQSLKTRTKIAKRTLPNAIIAVVLPNFSGKYNYFVNYWKYIDQNNQQHLVRNISLNQTFKIIARNMFNLKEPMVDFVSGKKVYHGNSSYITVVEWNKFIKNMDYYFKKAITIRNSIADYNLSEKLD